MDNQKPIDNVTDFDFSVIASDCESSDGQTRHIFGQVKTGEKEKVKAES